MATTTVSRVAAVQAEPAWLDLQAGVDKTCALIAEAKNGGADLVAFPEVWIPGYPWCMWAKSTLEAAPVMTAYRANSMAVDSPQMAQIRIAARNAGIWVVLGFSERVESASLYMAQVIINPEGDIVLHRRKIKPTGAERAVWGDGQAESLRNVVQTPFGRISALNCWEHLQPLLRYHTYSQNTQIHVAAWPPMFAPERSMAYHDSAESNQRTTQFMATEGQCFVVCSTQVMSKAGAEKMGLAGTPLAELEGASGGFAAIFGPDGRQLTPPTKPGEEVILYQDIDLKAIDAAKMMCDPVGHYSRPDLLALLARSPDEPAMHVVRMGGSFRAAASQLEIPALPPKDKTKEAKKVGANDTNGREA